MLDVTLSGSLYAHLIYTKRRGGHKDSLQVKIYCQLIATGRWKESQVSNLCNPWYTDNFPVEGLTSQNIWVENNFVLIGCRKCEGWQIWTKQITFIGWGFLLPCLVRGKWPCSFWNSALFLLFVYLFYLFFCPIAGSFLMRSRMSMFLYLDEKGGKEPFRIAGGVELCKQHIVWKNKFSIKQK